MSVRETYLASTLLRILGSFAWNAGLGHVTAEMLHLIIPATNLQRRPDLSFVSFKRWPRDREVPITSAWDVVPNLAIEVVSPSNSANQVMRTTKDYFESGVERVWVIYPEFAEIYDYTSPASVHILAHNQALEGGTLLPGFRLPLTELFGGVSQPVTDASA
jgi:Uma2 family endonuclease